MTNQGERTSTSLASDARGFVREDGDLRTEPSALKSDALASDSLTKGSFRVNLANFDGPFDLLLSLITKHELDITEVSLSKVTDEFITFIGDVDSLDDLDRASDFLVVAATLLDLKIAGLLPRGELVDAEDVALLEARDLLFARLLQYRAFKSAAMWLTTRFEAEIGRHARYVALDEKFRQPNPELVWTHSSGDIAAYAFLGLLPAPLPVVGLDHLHAPVVSLREQAAHVVATLRRRETMTFRELVSGINERATVVARFLALLELYRHGAIGFDQIEPLGELTLRWVSQSWSDEILENLGADYAQ